jgi:Bacteriodetes cell division protein (FtsL-like)
MEEKTGNIKEEAKANPAKQLITGSFIKELLSGSMVSEKIILRNLGYITLITFLTAIYIGNRFHAEKITRESTKLQREVKDLRAESLSTSADLMSLSKQSEVFSMVREKGLNLEELKSPPYKLLVDKK